MPTSRNGVVNQDAVKENVVDQEERLWGTLEPVNSEHGFSGFRIFHMTFVSINKTR